MSEQEVRAIARAVCAELDRRVRDAVRGGLRRVALPAALGAGLTLGGCLEPVGQTFSAYGAPGPAPDADVGSVEDVVPPADTAYAGPDPADVLPPAYDAYGVPFPDEADEDAQVPPAEPLYMAPDPADC